MQNCKTSNGQFRFSIDEWLTANQIRSYFSRLKALNASQKLSSRSQSSRSTSSSPDQESDDEEQDDSVDYEVKFSFLFSTIRKILLESRERLRCHSRDRRNDDSLENMLYTRRWTMKSSMPSFEYEFWTCYFLSLKRTRTHGIELGENQIDQSK